MESKNAEYIEKIKEKYKILGMEDKLKEFEKNKKGLTSESKKELLKEYPDIPKKLIELLEYCDGSDPIYFLGSDIDNGKFPYYLLSSSEILKTKDYPKMYHSYDINREDGEDGSIVGEEITSDINNVKWIHFADCMNNGGTSRLYIDFTPSDKGKKGQVIRFVHDDDRLEVIADSFDDYLKMLIDNNLPFIYNYEEEMKEIREKIKSTNKKTKEDYLAYFMIVLILTSVISMYLGFYLVGGILGAIFFLIIVGIFIFEKKDKH